MSALISFGEPLIYLSAVDKNARVRLFVRCVCFSAGTGWQQAEAARLDAAIARNLKELGYDL
ncbi:MAG: hypothetical protein WHS46_10110 [Desulfosoma sp.]